MNTTGESAPLDEDLVGVLGTPPALTADVWERMLGAAFSAPEDASSDLLPDENGYEPSTAADAVGNDADTDGGATHESDHAAPPDHTADPGAGAGAGVDAHDDAFRHDSAFPPDGDFTDEGATDGGATDGFG